MEIIHQRRIISRVQSYAKELVNIFFLKVKENARQLYSLNALFEIPVFEISQSNGV